VRSTYNIRVGRADRVTGPYLDSRDVPMTDGGGDVLLSTLGSVRGPGHNSVLVEGDRFYLVHHYYDADDGGRSKLQIRPLSWREDGWPVAEAPIAESP
jgi:arabinan endo-1,5-alpha-L-arabinosidase